MVFILFLFFSLSSLLAFGHAGERRMSSNTCLFPNNNCDKQSLSSSMLSSHLASNGDHLPTQPIVSFFVLTSPSLYRSSFSSLAKLITKASRPPTRDNHADFSRMLPVLRACIPPRPRPISFEGPPLKKNINGRLQIAILAF